MRCETREKQIGFKRVNYLRAQMNRFTLGGPFQNHQINANTSRLAFDRHINLAVGYLRALTDKARGGRSRLALRANNGGMRMSA